MPDTTLCHHCGKELREGAPSIWCSVACAEAPQVPAWMPCATMHGEADDHSSAGLYLAAAAGATPPRTDERPDRAALQAAFRARVVRLFREVAVSGPAGDEHRLDLLAALHDVMCTDCGRLYAEGERRGCYCTNDE